MPRSDSLLAAGADTDETVFFVDAKGHVRELWSATALPAAWNSPANTINYEVGGATPADEHHQSFRQRHRSTFLHRHRPQ
jgi:hypothetical protein